MRKQHVVLMFSRPPLMSSKWFLAILGCGQSADCLGNKINRSDRQQNPANRPKPISAKQGPRNLGQKWNDMESSISETKPLVVFRFVRLVVFHYKKSHCNSWIEIISPFCSSHDFCLRSKKLFYFFPWKSKRRLLTCSLYVSSTDVKLCNSL